MNQSREVIHNGVLMERLEDFENGEGLLTKYAEDGVTVISSERVPVPIVVDLPPPTAPPDNANDPIAAFSETLRSELATATTIAKVKVALTDALNQLDAALVK